jgi:predicted RNA-binding Zn ribbon-like protein
VVTDADAAAARELRDALVMVLLAHNGTPEADGEHVTRAERLLEQAGIRYPLTTVITTGGASILPGSAGVPGMFGAVLAAVTELALRDEWSRLKACANPPCHLGFVDRTRNRAGRFCGSACASQVSVRAYRQRKSAAAGSGASDVTPDR